MLFIISGKIKPYVRMTQRGKFVKANALEYYASKADIGYQLKNQMQKRGWSMLPGKTPLRLSVVFTVPERLHCNDLDNLIKALSDAAQGIVFKDDRWIDEIHATRRSGVEYSTRMTVQELTE